MLRLECEGSQSAIVLGSPQRHEDIGDRELVAQEGQARSGGLPSAKRLPDRRGAGRRDRVDEGAAAGPDATNTTIQPLQQTTLSQTLERTTSDPSVARRCVGTGEDQALELAAGSKAEVEGVGQKL